MINVALLGIIRRWHIRDQIPLREISRRLGISRNTVRRYLRSETTEPTYAERRIASGLDKYSVQLSGWLKAETSKPRKQRRSLKQIHADLKELGYEGSYDRVAAFARQWKAGQTEWVNSSSKRTLELLGRAWVAEINGEIVGFSYADQTNSSIWALFILPTHEGKGLAKQLLNLATVWLFDQGNDCVRLSTGAETRADRFYAMQGWTKQRVEGGDAFYHLYAAEKLPVSQS